MAMQTAWHWWNEIYCCFVPVCHVYMCAGEEACFNMHLGAYGQAYFAAETMEIVSGKEQLRCHNSTLLSCCVVKHLWSLPAQLLVQASTPANNAQPGLCRAAVGGAMHPLTRRAVPCCAAVQMLTMSFLQA